MEISEDEKPTEIKKRKYIPGLAQLNFELEQDWTIEQARDLFNNSNNFVNKDKIDYSDCISGMKNLPEECVDLIIADPPFGIDFSGKENQYNRKSDLVSDGYIEILENYDTFSQQWIDCLPRIMKETSSAYIISGWTNLDAILNAIKRSNLIVVNHIIWKYQFGVFTKRKFVSSHYHILFVVKNDKKYFFNRFEYYPEDVWEISREYAPGQIKNGTKLPDELVKRFINFSSQPGDLVFDPFMGNGTTAVCSKGLYRHYFGYELNSKMLSVHQQNLDRINLGEWYKPLKEYIPSLESLLEKYPHLKKYVNQEETPKKTNKSLDKFFSSKK